MITVAVIAVLLGIGFPSFKATMRSSRVTSQANALLSAVNLARTEAIRTNLPAGVCTAAVNGTACGGTWTTGYLVFDDTNANGTADAGEVVRVFATDPNVTLVANGALVAPILFSNQGLPTTAIPPALTPALVLTPTDCPSGQPMVRNFLLNTVGQLRIQVGNCP